MPVDGHRAVSMIEGMDEMGTLTYSPKAYGGLLAKTLPKVIETDRELDHFAEFSSRLTG